MNMTMEETGAIRSRRDVIVTKSEAPPIIIATSRDTSYSTIQHHLTLQNITLIQMCGT
jgi:hypothetical protein